MLEEDRLICSVRVHVNDLNDALQFYIDDLNLFTSVFRYSERARLLQYKHVVQFCLYIEEQDEPINQLFPLFKLKVPNLAMTYNQIKKINFQKGGLSKHSQDSFFEFPLGRNFSLIDPSGNQFLIYDGHG